MVSKFQSQVLAMAYVGLMLRRGASFLAIPSLPML